MLSHDTFDSSSAITATDAANLAAVLLLLPLRIIALSVATLTAICLLVNFFIQLLHQDLVVQLTHHQQHMRSPAIGLLRSDMAELQDAWEARQAIRAKGWALDPSTQQPHHSRRRGHSFQDGCRVGDMDKTTKVFIIAACSVVIATPVAWLGLQAFRQFHISSKFTSKGKDETIAESLVGITYYWEKENRDPNNLNPPRWVGLPAGAEPTYGLNGS